MKTVICFVKIFPWKKLFAVFMEKYIAAHIIFDSVNVRMNMRRYLGIWLAQHYLHLKLSLAVKNRCHVLSYLGNIIKRWVERFIFHPPFSKLLYGRFILHHVIPNI